MSEPLDIDALEKLAKDATPGPWRANGCDIAIPGERCAIVFDDGARYDDGATKQDLADARYIAALSPDVVLGLVEEVRRLRLALAESEGDAECLSRGFNDMNAGCLALEAELAATRKAKAENDERFQLEAGEARAERDALKLAWANFGGRIDHDSRCRTVTVAMPYPPPTAEGCDCGLRDLSLAMEAK